MARTGTRAQERASTSTAPASGTSSKKHLSVAPITRVGIELWTWLYQVSKLYRDESGDISPVGHNLDRMRAHWAQGGNEMMLWALWDSSTIVGYAITEVTLSHQRECFVSEAWCLPRYRGAGGIIRLGLTTFEGWAKALNCACIKFGTHRSSRAYERVLRSLPGWRQEAVFVKPLSEVARG